MKKIFLSLLFIVPLLASAQVITYDTVRVSSNDERNIYRSQQQTTQTQQQPMTLGDRRVVLDRESISNGGFDKSKLRFGANLGLSLSRNYTVLGLGPQVGYQFSDKFMAGAGIKYYYTKVGTYDYQIKNNMFGTNVFGYFYPVRFLAVFAQPELNYIWSKLENKSTGEITKESGFVPSLIVGGGLRLGRSHITLNYDLARHSRSPYPSGFYLGFSTFF